MTQKLVLKKDQERRIKAGHCWIYSNEVDVAQTPLSSFTPGEAVAIVSQRSEWIGWGYVNPHTLISARVMSTHRELPLGRALLVQRLKDALALRERFYAAPFYRLVFGEGDGLPGLVVDRFNEVLVVQITTAGMELLRDDIVAALEEVIRPSGILLRNDNGARALEQLSAAEEVEVAAGSVPEMLEIVEGGCQFRASARQGQKTGWFYDHAANRDRLMKYLAGRRVLDVFSYVGAWGVRAAAAGAAQVTCIDSSEAAVDAARENAAMNGFEDRMEVRKGDAFDTMKALQEGGALYDVVVLDPPAFIKRRKDSKAGMAAYQRLNQSALGLLAPGGVLVSSSCSFHLPRDEFLRVVQRSTKQGNRQLQLLEEGRQGPDHPQHPAIPETGYLKTFFLHALNRF